MSDTSAAGALDEAERDELERLRREVAALRPRTGAGRGAGGVRRRARAVAAGVLVVLVALLTPLTLVARYLGDQLLDTDRYVDTVAPLADDPAVQDAVVARVTAEVTRLVDVEAVARDALGELAERGAPEVVVGLAVPLAEQVESFTRDEVRRVVTSPRFAEAWVRANRVAHEQLDALLTGDTGELVRADDGRVAIDLGAVVDRVRERLLDRGFSLAERIPDVDAELTIVDSDALDRAQVATRRLDASTTLLPLALALVAGLAVATARDRRRGLVAIVVAATVGVAVLALGLAGARAWYLEHGAPERLPAATAVAIGDTLLAPLRTSMRAALVMGAVATAVLVVTGPSPAARHLRRVAGAGVDAVHRRLAQDGAPGSLERWVGRNRRALQLAAGAAGLVTIALWPYPSAAVVLWVALAAGAVALVVEVLGRRPAGFTPEG